MSATVNVYYHPAELGHRLLPGFAEKPKRLEQLTKLFNAMSLPIITPPAAQRRQLLRAHTPAYIDHVKSLSEKNLAAGLIAQLRSPYVQWYTRVSPGSYNAALYAAGSVCQAVDDTLSGQCNRAFCAVRPPGHHAGPERGEGFCLFNNIAIGALHALDAGAKRVAIIDFDRHHGNGTQDIVAKNPDILFISSYQAGCKYNHNQIEGRTAPNLLTVPVPQHSDFSTVEALYRQLVIPALYDFKPDLILISAGFDMHKADPLTNLRLEAADYFTLTNMFVNAANDLCDGRVVSSLEGGYNVKALENCVGHHLRALQQ